MPIATGTALAIGAGVSALSAGGQAFASGKTNKKTREWNEHMYGVQRKDAMDDWNRQNAYNSPLQQMQRLKEAGLNPNLVYGEGATHSAAPVRSTDVKGWNPETPNIGGLAPAAIQGIQAYQDYTLQQETIKNMEAQRQNMLLDSALKTMVYAGKETDNKLGLINLAERQRLFETSISTAEEQLRGLKTSTDIKIAQEVRDAAMHAPTISAALERVANLAANTANAKQQFENAKRTGILQQLDINLRKNGISPSDNIILRALSQFAAGGSLKETLRRINDLGKDTGVAPTGIGSYPFEERVQFPKK